MKLEGFGMGGRPRSTPQEMQEAKDMTRKKSRNLVLALDLLRVQEKLVIRKQKIY